MLSSVGCPRFRTLLHLLGLQVVLNICSFWGLHCALHLSQQEPNAPSRQLENSVRVSPSLQRGEYYDVCVNNAGLGGAVIAERYANLQRAKVLVVERRRHVIGDFGNFPIKAGVNSSERVLCYIQSFLECPQHGCQLVNEGEATPTAKNSVYVLDTGACSSCGQRVINRLLDHPLVTTAVPMENHGMLVHNSRITCGKVYIIPTMDRTMQSPTLFHDALWLADRSRTRPSSLLVALWTSIVNRLRTVTSTGANSRNELHQMTNGGSLYESVADALSIFEKDTKTLDLIVSRCGENVGWIRTLQDRMHFDNIFIYNKCGKNDDSFVKVQELKNVHVADLANVGREGATWLHHMLRTDIELASHNLMVQGKHETKLKQLQSLVRSLQFSPEIHHFIDLSRHPAKKQSRSRVCWSLNNFCAREYNFTELCNFCQTYSSTGRTCSQVIPTLRGEFYVSARAIRRNILTRRRLFEDLLDILNRENDPPFGHHLERCWGEILSG